MLRPALLSLALHATLALFLVGGAWLLPGQSPKVLPVLAEVELVEQNTPAVGSAAAPSAAPAKAASSRPASLPLPPPPAPPSPAPRPLPARRAPPAPQPPAPQPPAPQPPVPKATTAAQAALAPPVPPGVPQSTGTGLVSGSHIIPAALDRSVRNVPPAYPREAVIAGEQGSVTLKVSIAADGSAAAVDIFQSSGYRLLDQAARQAVGSWHFIPARTGGVTVPSTMLLRIRFVLKNPEGSQ